MGLFVGLGVGLFCIGFWTAATGGMAWIYMALSAWFSLLAMIANGRYDAYEE